MERLLERIPVSRYRDNFILKGGMLVSSMIGIGQRSTMDMDATMTGQTLSPENALKIVGEIAALLALGSATGAEDGDHEAEADGEVAIVASVAYSNLEPGKAEGGKGLTQTGDGKLAAIAGLAVLGAAACAAAITALSRRRGANDGSD